MRKLLFSATFSIIVSCSVNYSKYPVKRTSPFPKSINRPPVNTDKEYSDLIKNYKPETTEVLNDLLNGSSDRLRTSISVHNKSACNMVLTISGSGYHKKIPVAAGKIGYAMVQRNQNYTISGMVCGSAYSKKAWVSDSYSITLSNK